MDGHFSSTNPGGYFTLGRKIRLIASQTSHTFYSHCFWYILTNESIPDINRFYNILQILIKLLGKGF